MNVDVFVQRLYVSAPTPEQLFRVGLSSKDANEISDYFRFRRRGDNVPIDEHVFGLVDLISKWDGTTVEIGAIRFADHPIDLGAMIQVGFVEDDPLIVDKQTGEIAVIDSSDQSTVVWKVARDSECCLDALDCLSRYFTGCAIQQIDYDNRDIAMATAKNCAALAGGDEYLLFYSSLIG